MSITDCIKRPLSASDTITRIINKFALAIRIRSFVILSLQIRVYQSINILLVPNSETSDTPDFRVLHLLSSFIFTCNRGLWHLNKHFHDRSPHLFIEEESQNSRSWGNAFWKKSSGSDQITIIKVNFLTSPTIKLNAHVFYVYLLIIINFWLSFAAIYAMGNRGKRPGGNKRNELFY